jgi:hypothetical protein
VSDELEQRLRDSLRAYADLVDAPEDDDLPTPTTARTTPRTGLRRWRGAILGAAAAAAVATGSVWLVTDVADDPAASSAAGSAESGAALSGEPGEGDSVAAAEDAAGSGSVLSVPASPEVGVAYAVELYTHCGVLGIDIGSVWFAADPPLVESPAGPPPGWGDPDQPGTVTLLTAGRAVFRDDAGHEVRLRADGAAGPPVCD